MRQKSTISAALLLCLGMALPVLAQETAATTAATVVATVNGTDITIGNLIVARNALPPEYQAMPDDLVYGGLLEQVIQQVVIEQSLAGKIGLLDELTMLNQRRTYLSTIMVEEVAATAVTDAALQAAYDAAYADFQPAKEYHAAHILVEDAELAASLLAEIQGGADFAALAAANSMDGSSQNGGDLGWFGLGMMVEPFEAAVVAAEVGKVTGPVETQFGYHLILVTEVRDSEKPTLDAVRAEIEAEVQKAAILAKVDEMVAGATVVKPDIQIDPAVLKDTALLEQ